MLDADRNSMLESSEISFFGFVVSFALILLSWSYFHWIYSLAVAICLLPNLFVITFLGWLFSRSCLRWCRISTNRKGKRLYILLTTFLVVSAPIYSYSFARLLARDFVHKLALNVKLEGQEVQLTDQYYRYLLQQYDVLDQPLRNVTSMYRLLEPVDGAKVKLRDLLQHKLGWRISDPSDGGTFRASCSSLHWGHGYEILLKDNGSLQITLEYGYPDNCRLRVTTKPGLLLE